MHVRVDQAGDHAEVRVPGGRLLDGEDAVAGPGEPGGADLPVAVPEREAVEDVLGAGHAGPFDEAESRVRGRA
ncbi:hypothetical protein CHO01_23660 [Cellulomonas hominis]|uniref:Uncharacterized protein n=1 Tax=Cellulomonas hominis TaxID=156981 RepID=A0A511FDC3_9CELL|nr:hypothetical protein CHO01_23660 [Cellulomonas hominis]